MCCQEKPNNGISLKGVLIHSWLNNPLAPCSLTYPDFLVHTVHFDIALLLLIIKILVFLLSFCVLYFKQYENNGYNMLNLRFWINVKLLILLHCFNDSNSFTMFNQFLFFFHVTSLTILHFDASFQYTILFFLVTN